MIAWLGMGQAGQWMDLSLVGASPSATATIVVATAIVNMRTE